MDKFAFLVLLIVMLGRVFLFGMAGTVTTTSGVLLLTVSLTCTSKLVFCRLLANLPFGNSSRPVYTILMEIPGM